MAPDSPADVHPDWLEDQDPDVVEATGEEQESVHDGHTN